MAHQPDAPLPAIAGWLWSHHHVGSGAAPRAVEAENARLRAQVARQAAELRRLRVEAPAPRGATALALALGGSSDVIGALAWARACGFERVVLVQPGSPPRAEPSAVLELQRVTPAEAGAAAPGGNFFDNGSMVAYLLSLDTAQLVAGYYLVQPKDDGGGKGFSRAALEGTTAALTHALTTHGCSALLGLDFGGDVALPDEAGPGGPYIQQRDWLNLLAAFAAAKQCGVEARLIAASPGVDAAAVAPEYERIRRGGATARVLEMDREGVMRELTGTAPPACTLPELPAALFPHRVGAALELRFCAELRTLDQRIMADVPAAKRGEHASKTYHMLVGAADAARDAPPGDGFFALGQFRSAEQARAHLHSSYATGIYDLGHLELSDSVQKVQEAAGISAPAVSIAQHR
eukprot:Transcript_13872.p1 GENE.Transcript_13872~~Transcript_13872.p1  ORF type:complete len:406 (+),score=189.68 Transcript_13872:932-2149(+)